MPLSLARVRAIVAALPALASPIRRRLVRGGFWSFAGDAGARMMALAGAVVVARRLGVVEYGAFALIQSTLVMWMTFAAFGMGPTATRYIAAFRGTEPKRIEGIAGLTLWLSGLTGLACALALFAAAPFVAKSVLAAPQLEAPLRMVAPILFLNALSGALGGAILGFESFQRLARVSWLASIMNFAAVVAGVSIWGLWGAILGLVVSETVRCAIMGLLAHIVMRENGLRLGARADLAETRILWQFSVPILLGAALHSPIMWACQAMIARQPGGLAELGLYDAAQKWMTVVTLVPMAASAAVGPIMANVAADADRATFKKATSDLAVVQLALTAAPAAIVAVAAPFAVRLFGASFAAASSVTVILMVLAPIFVLKHLYWQTLAAGGDAWATFWLSALWAVIALALTSMWQSGGAIALAQSLLVAYGVTLVASIALVRWIWRPRVSSPSSLV